MISMIVAYANRRVIGKEGKTPWHLPDDMRRFKALTTGHTVVMGRKTFAAIGKPLSDRRNVVLTRDSTFSAPGVEVIHSPEEVRGLGDVFIIGGAEIYQLFLEQADYLYITKIPLNIEGDAFFPEWDREAFTLVAEEEGVLNEKNTLPHTFLTYKRK